MNVRFDVRVPCTSTLLLTAVEVLDICSVFPVRGSDSTYAACVRKSEMSLGVYLRLIQQELTSKSIYLLAFDLSESVMALVIMRIPDTFAASHLVGRIPHAVVLVVIHTQSYG